MTQTTTPTHGAALRASVDVSATDAVTLLPLGAERVRVEQGLWARRQEVNRTVSLLGGLRRLEEAGNLHNLRLAAGQAEGEYRLTPQMPLPFLDSDVYKWLEAVGWELGRVPSAELERAADDVIGLVAAAQGEDGYLNSYWTVLYPDRRWQDLAHGHELYCAGHLIQAAVAHTRGRGDKRLLDVACGVVDDIDREFGHGRREGVPGHPVIEMALVELYRLTREARYLELARYFVEERGKGLAGRNHFGATYFQDHQSVREATTVTGHAVRALYLEAGVTDLYLETGDEALLDAQVRRWESMVSTKMYLTGGVGSRHQDEAFGNPYELPPDRAYNETCAAIASVMWSWRMLLATGESRYADLIERTLYNAFLPGFSLDGQRYFYVNTLHARVDPDLEGVDRPAWATHERQEWFACSCCPPNVMRILASLDHYLVTHDASGVQVQQYVAGSVSVPHEAGDIGFTVHTDYPWDGRVRVEVTATPGSEWALALRVPAWCDDASVTVGGEPAQPDTSRPGYLAVTRRWAVGDVVVLDLPMPVRVTEPHPRVDAVRGCVAVERGPLVYVVEGVDLPDGIDLADIALPTDPAMEAAFDPDLLDGVVAVTLDAVVRVPTGRPAELYRRLGDGGTAPEERVRIRAVPYFAWGNRGVGTMRVWLPRA